VLYALGSLIDELYFVFLQLLDQLFTLGRFLLELSAVMGFACQDLGPALLQLLLYHFLLLLLQLLETQGP
jgi:hypothetical protein